jgi:hypothetical protein
MATYGIPGSPTYAVAINSLFDMLDVLPDNSANLIDAQDVRDVVAGLYENIEVIGASLSVLGSSSVTYNNPNPTSVEVGGIGFNSTFSNISVQQVFDNLFYPYLPPSLTLTVSPQLIEYGDTSTTATINWIIDAGINNVVSSTLYKPLNPLQVLSTPNAFTSSSGISALNSLNPISISTFTLSVTDPTIYTATVSVIPTLRRFWGTLPDSSPLFGISSSTFTIADISTLSTELNESYVQSKEIFGNNEYVFFVWPSTSVNLQSFPPKVTINGISNNDWIKTRDSVVFTNTFGYTASYDVWRFNYAQGSFTSSYVIIS